MSCWRFFLDFSSVVRDVTLSTQGIHPDQKCTRCAKKHIIIYTEKNLDENPKKIERKMNRRASIRKWTNKWTTQIKDINSVRYHTNSSGKQRENYKKCATFHIEKMHKNCIEKTNKNGRSKARQNSGKIWRKRFVKREKHWTSFTIKKREK